MVKVTESAEFEWIDCAAPGEKELEELAAKFKLPSTLVQDCLDARHLPKFESFAEFDFIMLRLFDPKAESDADTVQELTRKIALILSPGRLITVHRSDFEFLAELRRRWGSAVASSDSGQKIAIQIFNHVAASYRSPMSDSLDQLERLEMGIFGASGGQKYSNRKGYLLKRRSFVFRRMLVGLASAMPQVQITSRSLKSEIKDISERIDSLLFDSDQLGESITTLMNLRLSMASHQTNEVIRVLTIFSMFLLPLNVITGIYGMNFEFMPELKHPHGYAFAIGLMVALELGVFFWFKKRGWLTNVI